MAFYLYSTNLKGVSGMKLHRELGINQKSAWHLAHRIHEVWNHETERMAGPVEANEAYMGDKKLHAGRGTVGKTAVVELQDRQTNRVQAQVVIRTDARTRQGFVHTHTDGNAQGYTDEASAYEGLNRPHSVSEYVNGVPHTTGIESFRAVLKWGHHGTCHKIRPKHLDRHVKEFAGHHNVRRRNTQDLMGLAAASMSGVHVSQLHRTQRAVCALYRQVRGCWQYHMRIPDEAPQPRLARFIHSALPSAGRFVYRRFTMKMRLTRCVVCVFLALVSLGAAPVYAAADAPAQDGEALSLAEAESLAAQYGIGFEPNPGEPLPTREALQAGLEFIRNISVSSETVPMDSGDIASDSENRTCEHRHGLFASMFQYLTLTLGTIQESDAYVELTRHDHEFRHWNIPNNTLLDMWVSHVDKDDHPVGHTGWDAKISYRLYYRWVGFTTHEDHTKYCTVYP